MSIEVKVIWGHWAPRYIVPLSENKMTSSNIFSFDFFSASFSFLFALDVRPCHILDSDWSTLDMFAGAVVGGPDNL